MKKIISALILAMVTMLLVTSVFAVPFTPSAEKKDTPVLVGTLDEDTGKMIVGTIYNEDDSFYRHIYIDELIVTPILHLSDETKNVPEVIEKTLLAARDELKANTLEELVPGFAEYWMNVTGGAPVENGAVSDIFDVRFVDSLTGELVAGRYASFKIRVEYLNSDDLFVLIHKPTGADVWSVEEVVVSDGDVLFVTVESLSPFAIVKDTGAAPAVDPNAPDSPQTGVESASYALPLACFTVTALTALYMIARKNKRTAA
jgi:hypothetical protein